MTEYYDVIHAVLFNEKIGSYYWSIFQKSTYFTCILITFCFVIQGEVGNINQNCGNQIQ